MKGIPKSRAKTAYGLLNEIKRLILEEPKRYNQEVYLATDIGKEEGYKVPPCGTMGCVAGWVCALKSENARLSYHLINPHAGQTLGLNDEQRHELFNAYAIDVLAKPGMRVPNVQTKAYARLGVKHITAFQQKYAAQLKATRV